MNNSDIAKKYGITEHKFFSDECLKFYSKVERELIEFEQIGINNLVNSGYELDENPKYYVKTNNIVNYEFKGKKYDLFEYKECFTYYIFLCNEKLKKFRFIILSDYKDFNKDDVYIYKDKYYCQYYDCFKALLVFNRNQVITLAGPFIVSELKKAEASEFYSKYFSIENNQVFFNKNISEFYESNDESILDYFNVVYTEIMKEECKKEKPEFKTFIENTEKIIDQMENVDELNKLLNKQRLLFENEEYRNFCNAICSPEIFSKNLLKNGEVRKNLKNNFWIYHEFKSSLRDPNNEHIEGEDFTFLILNAIKSLEYLLYRKISDYKDFQEFDNDDEITEKAMLDKMINYIKNHKNMISLPGDDVISKENFNAFVDSYIELLFYVKDECRNGYFHKHRIDDYENLYKKRKKVLEAIAKTIIILK